MKKFLKEVHSSPDGVSSSKRVVISAGFILIAIGYLANLFFDYNVEQFMFESLMYIVIAGFGITGAEKFVPGANKKAPTPPPADETVA